MKNSSDLLLSHFHSICTLNGGNHPSTAKCKQRNTQVNTCIFTYKTHRLAFMYTNTDI